ncbi:unnamed protein product [Vitrella brassicaformis CCMP3155]|uniref:GINS subunit domain-containing protein n=1 Tax=Vitrella brassicaformis (strain CCMP3155) TaxID=1169540 RepID=A0A0G4FL16_VITBC|nr:unnamed protein product [Vitrella brassicaformis CCMP3155]|eukprot:CEM14592.1 unnamed protein product [Vitrella brassicaformis CCMP3155]
MSSQASSVGSSAAAAAGDGGAQTHAADAKLLADLHKSTWLPPFDAQEVDIKIDRLINLWQRVDEILASKRREPHDIAQLAAWTAEADHRKREVLAYLAYRLDKLQKVRFEVGPVLPETLTSRLCDEEETYFNNFNTYLGDLGSDLAKEFGLGEPLDLTKHMDPPVCVDVAVRVLEDCEVVTISTDKDTRDVSVRTTQLKEGRVTTLLMTNDVEQLIRHNKVEIVQGGTLDKSRAAGEGGSEAAAAGGGD